MGLFDNFMKDNNKIAEDFDELLGSAMANDVYKLCDELKKMKGLDSRRSVVKEAIRLKCHKFNKEAIIDLYDYVKKTGSFFSHHPALSIVEEVLVEKGFYFRDDNNKLIKSD